MKWVLSMADSGTYDQATLLRRQKIADAMLEDSRKAKPIRHWAEGLSQVADAGMAGYFSNKVDQEGKASRAADTAALASLLGGGAPAPTAAPVAPVAAPETAPQANPVVAAMSGGPDYGKAIANIESGGAYDKLGPVTKTGDRAYGKYQVMGNNIPEWSKAATGREMTPQEFAASPSAQDAIFKQRFGSYVDKYGPEGAAKAWFAGEKGMNNPNAKDMLGTSVESYGKKFMSGLGGGAPQAPVAQAMAPPQMPAGQPAASGGLLASATPQQRQAIITGMAASEGSPARAIATAMLGNLTKADGPTDEIKEYTLDSAQRKARGEQPLSFFDFKSGLKKAGATNVTTNVGKDEEAFDKESGKIVAGRFNDLAAEGPQAKQMISDVQTLQQLGTQIGTGKTAQAKATLGPYAEALGVKIDGLSDIQAYEAIVNRLAPNLRVKGSGAQSDLELKNFLKSLPSLGNTPGGNELVAKTMEGLAANKAKAAEIGSMALNKEITRKEAEKQLRELPDPMQGWRDAQKAAKPAPAPEAAAPDRAAIEAEMKRRGLLK